MLYDTSGEWVSATKGQILALTRCRFFLHSKKLTRCEVTKKALRESLLSICTYEVLVCKIGEGIYGSQAGKEFFKCLINVD